MQVTFVQSMASNKITPVEQLNKTLNLFQANLILLEALKCLQYLVVYLSLVWFYVFQYGFNFPEFCDLRDC